MALQRYVKGFIVALVAILIYYAYVRIQNVGENGYGSSTTYEQVTEGIDLSGKVMIVTGANAGIGYHTSVALALRGAKVVVACRDFTKAQRATDQANHQQQNQGGRQLDLIPMEIDLSSLKSVREFARRFKELNLPLHCLILNAAASILPQRGESKDGLELQMAVGHVGHFYLTQELLPILESSSPSRVVVVSSGAHSYANENFVFSPNLELPDVSYSPFFVYANTKLANILFAREFDELYHHSKGIAAVSLDPGASLTQLSRDIMEQAAGKTGVKIVEFFSPLMMKTNSQIAATSAYCAVTDLTNLGGKYFCDVHVCQSKFDHIFNQEKVRRTLWENTEAIIQSRLRSLDEEERKRREEEAEDEE